MKLTFHLHVILILLWKNSWKGEDDTADRIVSSIGRALKNLRRVEGGSVKMTADYIRRGVLTFIKFMFLRTWPSKSGKVNFQEQKKNSKIRFQDFQQNFLKLELNP